MVIWTAILWFLLIIKCQSGIPCMSQVFLKDEDIELLNVFSSVLVCDDTQRKFRTLRGLVKIVYVLVQMARTSTTLFVKTATTTTIMTTMTKQRRSRELVGQHMKVWWTDRRTARQQMNNHYVIVYRKHNDTCTGGITIPLFLKKMEQGYRHWHEHSSPWWYRSALLASIFRYWRFGSPLCADTVNSRKSVSCTSTSPCLSVCTAPLESCRKTAVFYFSQMANFLLFKIYKVNQNVQSIQKTK